MVQDGAKMSNVGSSIAAETLVPPPVLDGAAQERAELTSTLWSPSVSVLETDSQRGCPGPLGRQAAQVPGSSAS